MTPYHAILGGVSAGMGVGVVPAAISTLFLNRHLLSIHPMTSSLSKAVTELIWRKGIASANISALRQCLDN